MINEVMEVIDSDTRPFWEGTLEKKLMIQYCSQCKEYQFYPRIFCKLCMQDVKWVEASGYGTVYSYTIVEHTYNKFFKDKVPYVVALIELDEGPRMMSNIINVDVEKMKVGLKVKAVFNEAFGEYRLLQFQPTN